MILGEKEFAQLPSHLKALFKKLPNPGSDEVVGMFPETPGQQGDVRGTEPSEPLGANTFGRMKGRVPSSARGDSGSAARFFYSSKASAADRIGSRHPTIKPISLMRWLIRLVTPPGGTVLDPFAGSGTTGQAAVEEGFSAILIEREAEYLADINRRMAMVMAGPEERQRLAMQDKQEAPEALPLFRGAT